MKIRVGSKVMYRGGFGNDAPTEVTIVGINICNMWQKVGREVKTAETERNNNTRLVIDLDNKHWTYGDQIDSVVTY